MSRRSGDEAVAACILQPWVNLARLDALSGDWEAALERLAPLRSFRSTGRLDLGSLRVPECGWQALAPTRSAFENTLDSMYVVDSLKALLLNGRFAEVLEFTSGLGPDLSRELVEFGTEASIIASGRLGEFAEARRIATRALGRTRGWERVVFTIRLAEAVANNGSLEEARKILAPVTTVVGKVSPEKKGELQQLYVLQRLSALCCEVGLDLEARVIAEDVFRGAQAAGDEVFEIESLRILTATTCEPKQAWWQEALAQREEATLYRRYRRQGQKPVPSPLLDRMYEQLCEFLAN